MLNKYLDGEYGKATKAFRDIPGNYVLSPSSVKKFFNNSKEWWNDRNGKITFDGNTATVLGSVIHASIEAYYHGDSILAGEVEEWLEEKYKYNPKVDIDEVLREYENMFTMWEAHYPAMYPAPDIIEGTMNMQMSDNILMAGTYDGYEEERGIVIDWKTCKKIPSQSTIDGYRYQMLSYCIGLIAEGKKVNGYRIVFIQRPTKTISARVWTFDIELSDELLMAGMHALELMKNTIETVKEYPHLENIIYRENPVPSAY